MKLLFEDQHIDSGELKWACKGSGKTSGMMAEEA
jgi:hypothetical protein